MVQVSYITTVVAFAVGDAQSGNHSLHKVLVTLILHQTSPRTSVAPRSLIPYVLIYLILPSSANSVSAHNKRPRPLHLHLTAPHCTSLCTMQTAGVSEMRRQNVTLQTSTSDTRAIRTVSSQSQPIRGRYSRFGAPDMPVHRISPRPTTV